jgi:hypothetical protein
MQMYTTWHTWGLRPVVGALYCGFVILGAWCVRWPAQPFAGYLTADNLHRRCLLELTTAIVWEAYSESVDREEARVRLARMANDALAVAATRKPVSPISGTPSGTGMTCEAAVPRGSITLVDASAALSSSSAAAGATAAAAAAAVVAGAMTETSPPSGSKSAFSAVTHSKPVSGSPRSWSLTSSAANSLQVLRQARGVAVLYLTV